MPGGIAYPLMDDEAGLKERSPGWMRPASRVADLEVVALRPETDIAAFRLFRDRRAARRQQYPGRGLRSRSRPVQGSLCGILRGRGALRLTADLEFMPWTMLPDLATASASSRRWAGQCRHPGRCAAFRPVEEFDAELARVPAHGCIIGNYATARPSGRRRRRA
jgi:hypothetical protein